MIHDVEEILISKKEIQAKVKSLGEAISRDYKGQDLLVVGILKGASVFMADLIQAIDLPLEIDFMAVSSYGMGTQSTGEVRIIKDIDKTIVGRNLLIVEDIVDTGLTLSYLNQVLKSRGAKDVKICTLLTKPDRRQRHVDLDYCGFEIEDKFIVGYGIDYAEKYRNLPFIGYLKAEIYENTQES
ncbi:MAG: hypoxanthine phosphoribosyltransferase [Tissierellia bacterium]|nr:hypoxanthine phosphoribosyltransferase [Tissierellia bacterium]